MFGMGQGAETLIMNSSPHAAESQEPTMRNFYEDIIEIGLSPEEMTAVMEAIRHCIDHETPLHQPLTRALASMYFAQSLHEVYRGAGSETVGAALGLESATSPACSRAQTGGLVDRRAS